MTKEENLSLLKQVWENITNDILSKDEPVLGYLLIVPRPSDSIFKTTVAVFAQTQVGDPDSIKTIQDIAYYRNGVINTVNQKPYVTKEQINAKEILLQSFCDKEFVNDLLENNFIEKTNDGVYRLPYSRLSEEFGFSDDFQSKLGYDPSLETIFKHNESFNTYSNPGKAEYYRRAEIMDFYTIEELQGLETGR